MGLSQNHIWKKIGMPACLFSLLLSSCSKKDDSAAIVIPPGTEVQYSNSEFAVVSKGFYTIELKKWEPLAQEFNTVDDITPTTNKESSQTINYVIPKDKNTTGIFIVQATLSRQSQNFSAFVLPGRLTNPDYATTLIVELLSQYNKQKDLSTYHFNTIVAFETAAREIIKKVNETSVFPPETTLESKYRFYRNAVASNIPFLKMIKDYGVSFSFDEQGIVSVAPYPFGRKNTFPILDTSNATPRNRDLRGTEKKETMIRGPAIDQDNDLVLYQWYKDGQLVSLIPLEFHWTPDYDSNRAEPYIIKLVITDGGTPQTFSWILYIENMNRKPVITESCSHTVKEWDRWTCHISAVDFDSEAMSFTVNDQGLSARVKMNGLQTDDTSRKLTLTNVSEVDIEFTPNNADALTRSAYIEVTVSDVSGGDTLLPINLAIEDINSAPDLVGTYTALSAGGGQHEWDYCSDLDPDGKAPFYFQLEVRDPDNQMSAAPRNQNSDTVSVNIGGSLKDAVVRINDLNDPANYVSDSGCGISDNSVSYFCYMWKPTQIEKSGAVTIQMKDNHGGISDLKTINLVATDRNQKPCLTPPAVSNFLHSDQNMIRQFKYTGIDNDLDSPFLTIENMDSKLLPFVNDCSGSGSNPLVLKQTFGRDQQFSTPIYSVNNTTGSGSSELCLKSQLNSDYAGTVSFSRNLTYNASFVPSYNSNVTIPAGYSLKTDYATYGLRVDYQVASDVVINPWDVKVVVPVKAVNRTAAVGKVNRVVSSGGLLPGDLVVTNTAALDVGGQIKLTRTVTTSSLQILKGTVFGTTESAGPTEPTIQFTTMRTYTMGVGVNTLFVDVARKNLSITTNMVHQLSAVLDDPTMTVSNENTISDTNGYSLYLLNQYGSALGVDKFCFNVRAEDGSLVTPGALNQFLNPDPLWSGISLTNTSNLNLTGVVKFTRSVADAGTSVTIPVGTQLSTSNRTIFKLKSAVVLGVGSTTEYGFVYRDDYKSPLPLVKIPPGFLSIVVDTPPPALGVLSVNNNSAVTSAVGSVILTRSLTGSAVTLPAGFKFKDSLYNLVYKTTAPVTFAGTASQAQATVQLVSAPIFDSAPSQLCLGFSDTNYTPQFLSPMSANVNEGATERGYLLEVNDNISTPANPKDPLDRHDFTFTPQGLPPAGPILFCREPADNDADISSPACTPCSTPVAGDYFDSAQCYVRYKPVSADITQTFSYLVTVNDHGMTWPAGTNTALGTFSVKVVESNDPPVITDSSYSPLAGNTAGTPLALGGFTEGSLSEYFIYASDPDRDANNKKVQFSIEPQVYDVSKSAWVNRPTGLAVSVVGTNTNPFGTGWASQTKGKISWTPTDSEAKNFASASGFVIKVKAFDAGTPALFTYGYYLVTVTNINNIPSLKTALNLTITADTYFKNSTATVLIDKDSATAGTPPQTTSLSLCKSTSVFNCAAPLNGWPDELKTYDSSYTGNTGALQCRSGSALNTAMALPYLTRMAGSTINSNGINYTYQIEWCAQKSHIGSYMAFLNINDNGDKDRNNLALPSQSIQVPLNLKVVAPVFFLSPGKDAAGNVIKYMKRAFVGSAWNYYTMVNNSRGNALTYSLLQAPVGMTINSSGLISWTPTADQMTTSADPLTWPVVSVKVRDNTTGEFDTAQFPVQVLSPLSPVQVKPVIGSFSPGVASVNLTEKTHNIFSVSATDSNADPIFYRWYVDGVLKSDGAASFDYIPGDKDGYTDPDGTGSLKPGQHTVLVQVTDGYQTVTKSWTTYVSNNIPAPIAAFNLLTYVSGISNLTWGPEVGVTITSGASTVNSLIFTGSYTRTSVLKNFVYNLIFTNGNFTASTSTVKSTEAVNWASGYKSERISSNITTGTNFDIIVSSQKTRTGSLNDLTLAAKLSSGLGMTGLNASNLCTSNCPQSLYTNESYGYRPTAAWSTTNKYLFYASDTNDQLLWDRDSGSTTVFYNMPGNVRVAAMAIHTGSKRLYVTARDIGNKINQILIFDISPVTTGASPSYITTVNVDDGVNSDNRILDLVVVESLNKIYMLLPGAGEIAVLSDPGTGTPNTGHISFLGVGTLGYSYSDQVGMGRKLVYNTGSKLIYGIIKESKQVFSLDPQTNDIKTYAADYGFDSLYTFNNDYLTLAINKTLGLVYVLK